MDVRSSGVSPCLHSPSRCKYSAKTGAALGCAFQRWTTSTLVLVLASKANGTLVSQPVLAESLHRLLHHFRSLNLLAFVAFQHSKKTKRSKYACRLSSTGCNRLPRPGRKSLPYMQLITSPLTICQPKESLDPSGKTIFPVGRHQYDGARKDFALTALWS
jgi:hypothetical protein